MKVHNKQYNTIIKSSKAAIRKLILEQKWESAVKDAANEDPASHSILTPIATTLLLPQFVHHYPVPKPS